MADTNGWEQPEIKMVQKKGKLMLNDNASSFNYKRHPTNNNGDTQIISLLLEIKKPSGTKLIVESTNNHYGILPDGANTYNDDYFEITLDELGEYELKFSLKWRGYPNGFIKITNVYATTYIFVNPDDSKELKPYSLGETIRRLLDLTPTRTTDEQNRYTFDPIQLVEYDEEESPEFAFTGHTLFEALLIIAQYKGAFPMLQDGVISFRKLWSGEKYSEEDLPAPIEEISSSDINQYCTYLETEVQNLVGINDSQAGSIVEPYAGGYKTTRAESGSEISQDTAVISTDYNQYLHIKEEIGYIGDKLPVNNDITSYIYESGDYRALSDMTGAYPNSKAYSLQWSQMGKNITKLAHRIKSDKEIAQAFKAPAIANIIQAKTGESYDTGFVNYLCSLIDSKDSHSFADLMFRTTYIPVINSRIKQYKDYFGEFHHDGSLKYNQTAELVDSELYGEHLKQLIRKLGNATKRKIYIFDRIDDVPKVGALIDNYSVYDVQMSIRENKVIATISLVKYAELSRYIGVKNPWKDSDVSTDKCYNRQVSYNEFLLFTHGGNKSSTSKVWTETGLYFLFPNSFKSKPLTCVEATGYMSDETKLNTVLLPVVSLAIGNSIMFQWTYQNNYSAGYMSEQAADGATSVLSGTKYNRAQKAVKYCDSYGKLETYSFALMPIGPVSNGKNIVWVDGASEDGDLDVQVTNYPGTVELTSSRGNRIAIHISEVYPVDVTVKYYVTTTDTTINCTEVIPPGTASIILTQSFENIQSYGLLAATCYDISDKSTYSSVADVSRLIGYSLPLKPTELRKPSDLSEWKGEEYITVKKLLVEKNSSEALTFSVQMHYCSDNENFIVGSGLTNFCPLIGGEAEEIGLYGFTDRINIFKRRFSVNNATKLSDIVFKVNSVKKRIEISLPDAVNNYNAWALMGKDKNGNYQIIFGENKDLNGSDLNTELYLLPMHKLEDFI